jgi:hypothetical protein
MNADIKLISEMWNWPTSSLQLLAAKSNRKPEAGTWTLTSPSGISFTGDAPIICMRKEINSRVRHDVALARVILGVRGEDLK